MEKGYDIVRYMELIVELQVKFAEGKGEDEEADKIRDEMDIHWTNMPRGLVERFDRMIVRLNGIQDLYRQEGRR